MVVKITHWFGIALFLALVHITLVVINCLVALRWLFVQIARGFHHTNSINEYVRPRI